MPSIVARYRDALGQFCTQRTWELTNIARSAGITTPFHIHTFIRGINESTLTVQQAGMLSQRQVRTMALAPHVAQRIAAVDRLTEQLDDISGRLDQNSSTGRGYGVTTNLNPLSTYTNEEILNGGLLESVCASVGITLHRVDRTDPDRVRYLFQANSGDRFALRNPIMIDEFLNYLREGHSTTQIVHWLDRQAIEVDYAESRLMALLDEAQSLGIPNYCGGSSRPNSELRSYAADDIESLEAYVTEWRARARLARARHASVEGCACPECRFANHELSYGQMLAERGRLGNNHEADREMLRNVGTADRGVWGTSFEEDVRPGGDSITWLPMAERFSFGTAADTRGTARPRREGYYNSYGDWIDGRRPAAETRRLDTYLDPRNNMYDGFDSPENSGDDCEDDEENEGGYSRANEYGIERWDHRVPVNFNGESAFGTYFGMELEISGHYESAVILKDYPLWTAKWDGSVPGYEMVSEPMSYDYWMNTDLSFIPRLREDGMKAGRNGLHVHVSRNGFVSDWHRAKFIKLWMDASNYEEVRAFNRRHCGEYASPVTNLTNYQMARRIGVDYGSRYCLVNVQNRETIEMRGMASTLNRLKIRGTLAGIAASVEYCRVMSMQQVALGGLQWSGLVQWAQEQEAYKPFIDYLDILIEEGAPKSVRAARELVLA